MLIASLILLVLKYMNRRKMILMRHHQYRHKNVELCHHSSSSNCAEMTLIGDKNSFTEYTSYSSSWLHVAS